MKAVFEKRWAEYDEKALKRARDRQAWAEQAEERYRERMREMRETKRKQREEFLEAKKSEREDGEMISRMLDALCDLGSTANLPRLAAQKTSRSASAPVPRQHLHNTPVLNGCKMENEDEPIDDKPVEEPLETKSVSAGADGNVAEEIISEFTKASTQ